MNNDKLNTFSKFNETKKDPKGSLKLLEIRVMYLERELLEVKRKLIEQEGILDQYETKLH